MGSAFTKTRLRSQLWTGIIENDHGLIRETVREMKESGTPIDIFVTKDIGDTVYTLASTQMKDGKVTMETVKFLIQMGFDVNKKMDSLLSFTPLYAAVRRNQLEMVKLLLDHGADPKADENTSDDALFTACGMGYVDCVELLLKYKANPNSISSGPGGTPMMLCAQTSHYNAPRITQLLIEYGADINYINRVGRNVLHTCADCLADITDTIKIYLDAGTIDINKQDKNGQTPLHMAATANRPKIIQLLIDHGADPNIRSNEGKKPLDLGNKLNHEEVIQLLKKYTKDGPNVNPNVSIEDGASAKDSPYPNVSIEDGASATAAPAEIVPQETSQVTVKIDDQETVKITESESVDQQLADKANLIKL